MTMELQEKWKPQAPWSRRANRCARGKRLQECLDEIKDFKLKQEEVPHIIQLVENPRYDVGLFAGNVDLFTHDCIHILLGRGLLVKDEAFVIGYTMGSTKRMSRIRKNLFMFCSKYLYPEGYKFGEDERLVFNLGIAAGNKCPEDLSKANFNHFLDWRINEIREHFGIDVKLLAACYSLEKRLYRTSYESWRLIDD